MDEIIITVILLAVCYLSVGFFISLYFDDRYYINIPIGCMLFWPIITLIVGIFELCKFIKVLFKN